MSLIPVACYTCGKIISNKWDIYKQSLTDAYQKIELNQESGYYKDTPSDIIKDKAFVTQKILNDLDFSRMCCRRMFISQPDIIDNIARYDNKS